MSVAEASGMAMARAAASVMGSIRETTQMRTAEELPAGECAVKIGDQWFGFEGMDSRGRMVLWAEGGVGPHIYGPNDGETFLWRDLIGGG